MLQSSTKVNVPDTTSEGGYKSKDHPNMDQVTDANLDAIDLQPRISANFFT
jgi:hypothetical protein